MHEIPYTFPGINTSLLFTSLTDTEDFDSVARRKDEILEHLKAEGAANGSYYQVRDALDSFVATDEKKHTRNEDPATGDIRWTLKMSNYDVRIDLKKE